MMKTGFDGWCEPKAKNHYRMPLFQGTRFGHKDYLGKKSNQGEEDN